MVTPCLQGKVAVETHTHVAAHNVFPGKNVFLPVVMMMILNIVCCQMLHCVLMLCEMTMFSLCSKYLRRNSYRKSKS